MNVKDQKPYLVSIIIPLYNRETLVRETLSSVQAQTYSNWECIIVDDGSTDNSLEVVQELANIDARIRVFERHREPKGAPTCRNIGIQEAKGDFILFLDSDDLLAETCLEKRLEAFAKHPDSSYLVFATVLFKQKPDDYGVLPNILHKDTDDLTRFIAYDYPWNICAPLYRKSVFKAIRFDETLACHQDLDLAVRIITEGFSYQKIEKEPDVFIRMGNADKSSFTGDTDLRLQAKILLIENFIHYLQEYQLLNQHYRKAVNWLIIDTTKRFFSKGRYHFYDQLLRKVFRAGYVKNTEHLSNFIKLRLFLNQKHFDPLPTHWRILRKLYAVSQGLPKELGMPHVKVKSTLGKYEKDEYKYSNLKLLTDTPSEKRILLAGYPKSGNTWLVFLLQHVLACQLVDLDDLEVKRAAGTVIRQQRGSDFIDTQEQYNDYLICKTHDLVHEVSSIEYYGKRINIIRDPRDVVVSYFYYLYYFLPYKNQGRKEIPHYASEENQKNLSATFHKVFNEWPTHYWSWRDCVDVSVRYEDLHRNGVGTLRTVLDKLSLKVNEKLIAEAIQLNKFTKFTKKEVENSNHLFFRKGVVGDYKNHLDTEMIKELEEKLANVLQDANYDS